MYTSIADVRARGSLPTGMPDATIDMAIDEAYALMVARGDLPLIPVELRSTAERALALHALTLGTSQVVGESFEGISVSLAGPTGPGLEATSWGQFYLGLLNEKGYRGPVVA